ncbi:hypothetical protein ACOI1H_03225 [Loktanella sp. DJP18]|uniref:hypothetical protein n=1 Tax=Loktanella sp. DJP18 TaxID=3409788 RepID=UPI003BB7F724
MIEFLLMACLGGVADDCRSDQMLLTEMSLTQCNRNAQLLAASWAADHPDWLIQRYQCRPVSLTGTKT